MGSEKQIEELAFDIIMATSPLGVEDLTKQFDYDTVAKFLYNAGYRKQSDVAMEIFEEIEQLFIDGCEVYHTMEPEDYYELKKKYTEEHK